MHRLFFPGLICLLWTPATWAAPATGATGLRLLVEAGTSDRTNTLVTFAFRPPAGSTWVLRHEEGPGSSEALPVQVVDGQAYYLEPGLAAGTTRRYRLEAEAMGNRSEAGPGRVRVETVGTGDLVTLQVDGRPVATYVGGAGTLPRADIREAYRRGGYFHPVRTPGGRTVTDDYPPNHTHHHGLWWSWTKTRFEGRTPDFWNMGEGKGRVETVAVRDRISGPVWAGFRADHTFTDLLVKPAKAALSETWTVRVVALGGPGAPAILDLEVEQRCAGESPLELPRYYYGGFGLRGPFAWNGPNGARYLDANGVTNRVAANQTRARWHWLGGPVDGSLAGIASLGHPTNFRAPEPMRIHPGEPFTCWAPSQLGDWAIRPGEVHRARYRVVALDGEPEAAWIDRLWTDYATPPQATLSGGG